MARLMLGTFGKKWADFEAIKKHGAGLKASN
jgi:hypothetical protein